MKRMLLFLGLICTIILIPTGTLLAAPTPTVTLNLPGSTPIGEDFTFTVTFDNTGNPGDVAYGPFIDLILPTNGADGDDGISFIRAEYLGNEIDATNPQTFPADGCLAHPYLREADGSAATVCAIPGFTLVVLELPFGSFTPEQPAADIDVTATLSPLADLGTPLEVRVRGGFRFGATPVDDPCCDPQIPVTEDSGPTTPTIMTITKDNDAPEYEIAVGPNAQYTWTINVDIADGQTVNNLDITDTLPPGVIFEGVVGGTPAPAINGNDLTFTFPTVTGGPGEADLVIAFLFSVGNVLDPLDGQNPANGISGEEIVQARNQVTGLGDWISPDPRDGSAADNAFAQGGCFTTDCPGGAAPYLMPMAAQKLVTNILDPDGLEQIEPGDTIRYGIDFQISDYFAFADVVVTDILPDGLTYDPITPVELIFTYDNTTTTQALNQGTDFTVFERLDGSTLITFNVSVPLGDPILGGCVPPGSGIPDCTFNIGPTTGRLTYGATVDENFTSPPPGGTASLDHGDQLTNQIEIVGDILDPGNLPVGTGFNARDDSSATVTIIRDDPVKAVYAVNGQACDVDPLIWICGERPFLAAGDEVTYRIQHPMPISSFEDFSMVDYLPLPVFDATEVFIFNPTVDAVAPPAGTAKFGPAETLFGLSGQSPEVTTDAIDNTITFNYINDFNDPTNTATVIDLLFTVTLNNSPIADDLILTNLVQSNEGSTNSGNNQEEAIDQIVITAPLLRLSKGAVGSTAINPTYTPADVGPVVFNPPGSNPSFEPTITSDGLDATPIDSDMSGVKVGDLVTFAVVIENRGNSRRGAFDIRVRDIMPTNFAIPGSGLNLQARLGTGDPVGIVGNPAAIFTDGIELIDPDPDRGVCGPYSGNSGVNLVVITYDLQLTELPSGPVQNRVTLTNYSSSEGGDDFTGGQDERDEAIITFGGGGGNGGDGGGDDGTVTLTKAVDEPFATPGDTITWTISVENTSGAPITDITITDSVPPEVEVINVSSTRGTVSNNGSTYTIRIDRLEPGENATITISTRIRTDLQRFEIVNTASSSTGAQAQATVLIVETLPSTGESQRANQLTPAATVMVSMGTLLLMLRRFIG